MNDNNFHVDVILNKKKVATVTLKSDQLIWQYDAEWQQSGYAVSPHLPLETEIPPLNTQRFLRNFFPEGNALEELIRCFHLSKSNTFGLISALGLDLPGALIILSVGQTIEKELIFRRITEKELTERLDDREHFSLIVWGGKPRLSVAGVQDKINVIVNKEGQLGFGEGALCSTHILKFEKHKMSHLVLNEYITMQLAKFCGIKVADVEIRSFGKNAALLIKRFDRQWNATRTIKRLHVIDGCQALNLPPEYKYERNFGSGRDVRHIREGVSYAKLFNLAEQCINPVSTTYRLLDWALFNVLVFNYDAHGKNISFFVDAKGISLAPFYDLVNIKMYPDFEQEMAMALGDEFDGNRVNAYQLADFAASCCITRSLVARRLKALIHKLNDALDSKIEPLMKNREEQDYFKKYHAVVRDRCEHLLRELNEMRKVVL